MNNAGTYLIFRLDEQRYALALSSVERVFRVVELIPMPKAPTMVLGVVNVQGRIVPVVSVRKQFGLVEREPDLADQLIIVNISSRAVALLVDEVLGVVESSADAVVTSNAVIPNLNQVEALINVEGRTVAIQNLDALGDLGSYEQLPASEGWRQ